MKNTNIIIYAILGVIIVFLLSGMVYMYQDSAKKIAALNEAIIKKESEIKSFADISSKAILEKLISEMSNTSISEYSEKEGMDKIFDQLDKETKYCGTESEIAKTFFGDMSDAQNRAREGAQIASFNSSVSSVIPVIKTCMDDKKFVNDPKTGIPICAEIKSNLWPEFTDARASWGGCDFEIDKSKKTFKYCATFGEKKVVCTQEGCIF